MLIKTYPSITGGRNLFNCVPAQFDPFTAEVDPHIPRSGLLQEAGELFGYHVRCELGLWYVIAPSGETTIRPSRSQRQAWQSWWETVGKEMVIHRRQSERAWEQFRSPGRVSMKALTGDDTRPAIRESNFRIIQSIWNGACEILRNHTPMTEVWMQLAVARDLPRRHCVNRIGERRAMVEAVCQLYDVYGLNPEIAYLLDGGSADDSVIANNLMADFTQLTCEGNPSGLMARVAITVAVTLSPHPGIQVYHELHELLLANKVANRGELKIVADMVLS